MTPKTPVVEHRDLQAASRLAMKAYEDFDTDYDDRDSIAKGVRLWDEAIAANEALIDASIRRPAEVKLNRE